LFELGDQRVNAVLGVLEGCRRRLGVVAGRAHQRLGEIDLVAEGAEELLIAHA